MGAVDGRFLPMSLDDIVSAITELQETVSSLQAGTEDEGDLSSLQSKVDELEMAVEELKSSVEGFKDYSELESRIAALEESINSMEQSGSEQDISDLSERVENLEGVNEQFFG